MLTRGTLFLYDSTMPAVPARRNEENGMNAQQLSKALDFAEVNGKLAPDCRRVMVDENMVLKSALQSGDATRIKSAKDEAERVARMWGVID